jgi:resuscitation-promoting factor RpfB
LRQILSRWHRKFVSWPHRYQFLLAAITISTITSYGLSAGLFSSNGRAFADSSKIVSLFVDGQKRMLTTDAPTVGDVIARSGVKLAPEDLVEPAQSTKIPLGFFNINIYRARPVLVVDGGTKTLVRTAFESPRLIVAAAGITAYPEDQLSARVITNFVGDNSVGQSITMTRAKQFTVLADGKSQVLRSQGGTIAEALASTGVHLGEKDTVSPGLTSSLITGGRVTITRVTELDKTVEEGIARSVTVVHDNTLVRGTRTTRTAGSDGRKRVSYHINYRNGIEVSRKTTLSLVLTEAVAQVDVVGTKVLDPNKAVELAAKMASDRGWVDGQWDALYSLWTHESNFNAGSVNAHSGACGIPQAYPCSKLPGFSPSNAAAQIQWGLDYIAARYGTPQEAWAYWRAHHSY